MIFNFSIKNFSDWKKNYHDGLRNVALFQRSAGSWLWSLCWNCRYLQRFSCLRKKNKILRLGSCKSIKASSSRFGKWIEQSEIACSENCFNRWRQSGKRCAGSFELHGNKIEEKGKRDFGSYDSLEDVNKELKPHVENYQYKIRTSQKAKEGNKIIYDNGKGLKVRRIDNPEAACKYGSGSKWCVSSTYASVKDPGDPYGDSKTGKITKETDNHIYLKFDDVPHPLPFRKIHVLKHNAFHFYSHGGKNKMYIIHDENNGRKFAYHEGEDGDITRDEKDENIGTSNLVNMYPELSKIDELKKTVGGHHFIGSQEDFDDKFNEHFNKNNIKLQNLLKSNYLTDKHIDRLLSDENKFQPPVDIEKHPNIKDRHIDRLIDLGQSQNLLYNIPEKIKPEHIDKMFEENLHMGQNLAGLILQHPSVQYRHLK